MRIDGVGNVGIGTPNPKERLSVNGKIRAQEVKVESSNWPDYVFETSYKLPSLEEMEMFIKSNKHLPGIPSASNVAIDGLELGNLQNQIVKNQEEMILHLIEKSLIIYEKKMKH